MLVWALSWGVWASEYIDVYGLETKEAHAVLQKYGAEVEKIETQMLSEFQKGKAWDEDKLARMVPKKLQLIDKIKKEGNYAFVDFQTVFYPSSHPYTTIEIIKPVQLERMKFARSREKKDYVKKDDLVGRMIEFTQLTTKLMLNHEITGSSNCPIYHCIADFDHPKLKPYLEPFNQGALKQKKFIVSTIQKDENPERRAAAAFLIGHLPNPKEIIQLLLPHVNDADGDVRNNVIRVIAVTMAQAHITHINTLPFLELLDSPQVTDRNKSLYVLQAAAESKKESQIILEKGADKLLALLQLHQPNNHGPAYEILKKISGRSFGEYDIDAWRSWLNAHRPQAG